MTKKSYTERKSRLFVPDGLVPLMPSPFPGMDPYLEQPAFWSSFHSRLVVAIADVIEAMLDPQYYVEVETRTYYSDDDNSVLIGIPDAIVVSSPPNDPTVDTPTSGDSAVAVQLRPQQVTVPVPLEVNERYLEIRDVGDGGNDYSHLRCFHPKISDLAKGGLLMKKNEMLSWHNKSPAPSKERGLSLYI